MLFQFLSLSIWDIPKLTKFFSSQVLQVKKTKYEQKKKLLLENEPEYNIEENQELSKPEKAEVKIEDVKTNKPDEPVIGHSYGQAAGLKDDLDVDDDIGRRNSFREF